ncbi:Alanine--tRNA ligase [Geodia barretti]|uniref:Alanine--tRNA ligase n=1 Tax=Geodia barretti TaxID=519541 RepID=A0AA35RAD4_GEOBA|nr:Alanine--tRNA ligase [Geodia barretti]
MRYAFPCDIVLDDEEAKATGREAYVVTFPDVPEAITGGWSWQEALDMAEDCLAVALSFYVDGSEDLPTPGPLADGQVLIAVPLIVAAKAHPLHSHARGTSMPDFMSGDEIREKFLSYFEAQGHSRFASSSLIPVGDPTLLLTTAGMVQFKPYFTGEAEPSTSAPPLRRSAFRTPDIEEVGDATHNTLFEMLGNFSFGDYFKANAVDFAVELMTEGYGIPLDKFSAAIHHTDEETRGLWEAKGIPADKVYSYGDDENWDDCAPNCTNVMADGVVCDRYVELWNLVFMQYYHHLDGTRTNLPAPSVDTGMGFERLVRILQDVDTAYETDLFTPIIAAVERVSGKSYNNPDDTYAIRVVAEHGRSVTFLIADGVVPGNEGRGYVLRRVIRRAIRYARRIGIEGNFLGEIADATIDKMGKVYPELVNNRDFILTVLRLRKSASSKPSRTATTCSPRLLKVWTRSTAALPSACGTHTASPEMTQEIAAEQGVTVDTEGFEREMERTATAWQSIRAVRRGARQDSPVREPRRGRNPVPRLRADQRIIAPSVGLIADDEVVSEATAVIEVHDTQAVMPDVIMHFGKVKVGTVRLGDTVEANVDPTRREDTARNHTATHMLHAALREVLGPHVRQAGSLVAPERLRFDFSHVQPVTDDELWQVQHLVNEKIRQNAGVHRDEDTYQSAIQRGALAFFGDRYGERVRLIEIANGDIFSFEVCGGTHVHHTGEVGSVYILGESSIGAGMRRLEAVSGRAAERLVWERFNREDGLASTLNTTPPELGNAVQRIQDENDDLRRQLATLERQNTLQAAEILLDSKQDINGVSVLSARTEASNSDSMREISDWLRDKMGSGIVVLGAVINDRPTISVGITRDLVDGGADARDYARDLGRIIGGGGGGRPDMAQAGGRNADKLDEAIAGAADIVRQKTAS